ncbi:Uncharacterised protein [Shewanella putrefaciens]|nr:Uncharacterised protein [Shewanella putrefaciens]
MRILKCQSMKYTSFSCCILSLFLIIGCKPPSTAQPKNPEKGLAALKAQRELNEEGFQECLNHMTNQCESACELKPIDTYCAMKYMDKVIGSGCVGHVELEGDYLKQVKFCKHNACQSLKDDSEVIRGCRTKYPII